MAVSTFATASGVAQLPRYMFQANGAAYNSVTQALDPGYYMVSSYSNTGMGTAGAAITIKFQTSAGDVSVSTQDSDSGSTLNAFQNYVNLPNGATGFYTQAMTGTIVIEKISAALTVRSGTIVVVRTSGSVTIPQTAEVLAVGGGASGCCQDWGYPGGGGGSGYWTYGTLAAGTYTVTIGAGGVEASVNPYTGTAGGTTSIGSITAAGGQGGGRYNNPYGGNGGSGGGAAGWTQASPGKNGGSNGSDGGSFPGYYSGGTGSAVPIQSLMVPTPGAGGIGGVDNYGGGGGGGAYGDGGRGGRYSTAGGLNYGGAGVDGGGGGGGGSDISTSGSGGNGLVAYLYWS